MYQRLLDPTIVLDSFFLIGERDEEIKIDTFWAVGPFLIDAPLWQTYHLTMLLALCPSSIDRASHQASLNVFDPCTYDIYGCFGVSHDRWDGMGWETYMDTLSCFYPLGPLGTKCFTFLWYTMVYETISFWVVQSLAWKLALFDSRATEFALP